MTSDEADKPCVRGCRRRCQCPECSDQAVHSPEPRPAVDGLLCQRCSSRLKANLTEIVELFATLDTRLTTSGDESGRHRKVSGSPALSRLDVLALTDRRTRPGYQTDADGNAEPRQGYEALVHVPTVVMQWADCLADDLGLKHRADTLSGAVRLMRIWWAELCDRPWIDEMWDEIKQTRSLLGRAHGEQRPKPVGRCINVYEDEGGKIVDCGRMLYANGQSSRIRCSECGRVYDGLALARLLDMAAKEGTA